VIVLIKQNTRTRHPFEDKENEYDLHPFIEINAVEIL